MQSFLLFVCAVCLTICAAASTVYLVTTFNPEFVLTQRQWIVDEVERRESVAREKAAIKRIEDQLFKESPLGRCQERFGRDADLRKIDNQSYCCKDKGVELRFCNVVR
jgi:hypothetical protein